jgi:hypothetical protein
VARARARRCLAFHRPARRRRRLFFSFSFAHTKNHSTPYQVIGNKWDTYLELLQADYSET